MLSEASIAMARNIRFHVILTVVVSLGGAAAFAQSSGSAIYIPKCAGCHGVNGAVASEYMKSIGTPNASDPYILSLSAKQMFTSVKNGKGRMRPLMNGLTDAQIRDAVAYFRELGNGTPAPAPQAQVSNQPAINDSGEFNAFMAACSQSDPTAKAAALEGFLQTYPQSANKGSALNILMNTYRSLNDDDSALSAAKRGLQVDPNDENAIFVAVEIEIGECNQTGDAKVCNDAAALGQRGLSIPQPPEYTDDNWRKTIAVTYPYYRSAIALAKPVVPAPEPAPAIALPTLPAIAPPPPPADSPPPTIALGQTMDQVTTAFGAPLKVAKLGAKTIFYYKDMKVTFTNGKVTDVE
jgi:cytochrome c553